MTTLPDRGRLGILPLPTLLLLLHQARFTGDLRLVHDPEQRTLAISAGRPVEAHAGPREPGLCSALAAAGRLDASGAARASALAAQKQIGEEKAILALRLLGPRDLLAALRERARALALDAFAWPDAAFELVGKEGSDEVEPAPEACLLDDAPTLVLQGLATKWSPERIVATIGTEAFRFVRAGPGLDTLCATHPMLPGVPALCARLDGRSRLADLARDCGHPSAFAAAFVLDALGTFEYSDGPAPPADATPITAGATSPQIEIVIGDREAGKPAAAARSGRPLRAVPPTAGSDALRQMIREKRKQLESLDHYGVLGVPHNADLAAIRGAYVTAAKTCHPDVLLRLGLEDVHDEANAVFAALSKAHAVLSDPAARRDYDESDGEGGTDALQRVATAESLYRKGEVLLRKGSFDEALRFLQPAVELCGDDSVYQEACGWALFKKQVPEHDAARAALERAVGIDPSNRVARGRLAAVLRALGKDREAQEHLAMAHAPGGKGKVSPSR